MKKQKRTRARLPMEAVNALRHRGGAHSTIKGGKGYNRKWAKTIRSDEQISLGFFYLTTIAQFARIF